MSVRIHIERLVVDQSLVGSAGPDDVGVAVETELNRLLRGNPAERMPSQADASSPFPLVLSPHGTFAVRLAETLHEGVPALRSLRGASSQQVKP